jgi:hypothetical protein
MNATRVMRPFLSSSAWTDKDLVGEELSGCQAAEHLRRLVEGDHGTGERRADLRVP